MSRAMKPCWKHRQTIALLVAGGLAEDERRQIEDHIARCEACRGYHAELAVLVQPLLRLPEQLPDAEPTAAMVSRWNRAIHQAVKDRPVSPWPAVRGIVAEWRSLWGRRRALLSGLAVVWTLILFFRVTEPMAAMHASGGPTLSPRILLEALRSCAEGALPLAFLEPPQHAKPASRPLRPRSERPRSWLDC